MTEDGCGLLRCEFLSWAIGGVLDKIFTLAYLTGLINAVMTLAFPSLPKMSNGKLSSFEMLALIFMRIRLHYEDDIGYRF